MLLNFIDGNGAGVDGLPGSYLIPLCYTYKGERVISVRFCANNTDISTTFKHLSKKLTYVLDLGVTLGSLKVSSSETAIFARLAMGGF